MTAIPYLITWCPDDPPGPCNPCGVCLFKTAAPYVTLFDSSQKHVQYNFGRKSFCAQKVAVPVRNWNTFYFIGDGTPSPYWLVTSTPSSLPFGLGYTFGLPSPGGTFHLGTLWVNYNGAQIFSADIYADVTYYSTSTVLTVYSTSISSTAQIKAVTPHHSFPPLNIHQYIPGTTAPVDPFTPVAPADLVAGELYEAPMLLNQGGGNSRGSFVLHEDPSNSPNLQPYLYLDAWTYTGAIDPSQDAIFDVFCQTSYGGESPGNGLIIQSADILWAS